MRKKMAVMAIVISMSSIAAPAMASDARPKRQATTTTTQVVGTQLVGTQVVGTRPVETESEAARARLRRFCAANQDHERCQRPDINIRQLIWRLVKAGEWRQLFHLLHRLGII